MRLYYYLLFFFVCIIHLILRLIQLSQHTIRPLMQFQLLLNRAFNHNHQYLELLKQLKQKEENCIQRSTNQMDKDKCHEKSNHFKEYMASYRMQFKEKGKSICYQTMKQHSDLQTKIQVKDECVQFYSRSIPIVEENVIDKLKTLVKNTDFSQL